MAIAYSWVKVFRIIPKFRILNKPNHHFRESRKSDEIFGVGGGGGGAVAKLGAVLNLISVLIVATRISEY